MRFGVNQKLGENDQNLILYGILSSKKGLAHKPSTKRILL